MMIQEFEVSIKWHEEIKPVFVRSNFQEENSFDDVIGLSKALDETLLNTDIDVAASRGLIFVDVNQYENAYSIKGRYSLNNDEVNLQGRLFKGKQMVGVFEVSGIRSQLQTLIDEILMQVVKIMGE